jgi:hypothetical protein
MSVYIGRKKGASIARAKTNQQTVKGADTTVLKDNIQDYVVFFITLYILCLLPSLDDHVIIIYFLHNQG